MTDELFDIQDAKPNEAYIILRGKPIFNGELVPLSMGDNRILTAIYAREKLDEGIEPLLSARKGSAYSQWYGNAILSCPYCNKTHSGQGSGPTKSDAERLACNDFDKHTCRCGCQFRVDGRKIHQQD